MNYLIEYAMFLAKALTIVIAIGAVIAMIVLAAVKPKNHKGELSFDDLSKEHHDLVEDLQQEMLDKKAFKQWKKQQKHLNKICRKLFVVDFNGSMDAHEVAALREEMTAVIAVATKDDEVLVRLGKWWWGSARLWSGGVAAGHD